jgi:hypothetical protein
MEPMLIRVTTAPGSGSGTGYSLISNGNPGPTLTMALPFRTVIIAPPFPAEFYSAAITILFAEYFLLHSKI